MGRRRTQGLCGKYYLKRSVGVEIFQHNQGLDLWVAQAPYYLCDEKETASICYASRWNVLDS
ncbi:MAG: hypothetical protein MR982_02640 [Bacteroides pyogenes]|uniref:hypothetical protein n=1 Tax=Bacteroides pyogenes TaxID=310300 RepID=UPI0024300C26|nr:hypothetical protein [Bacteroides pyogenes]MCI7069865.1 hypothetical protein [Bacteroides pyogenes]